MGIQVAIETSVDWLTMCAFLLTVAVLYAINKCNSSHKKSDDSSGADDKRDKSDKSDTSDIGNQSGKQESVTPKRRNIITRMPNGQLGVSSVVASRSKPWVDYHTKGTNFNIMCDDTSDDDEARCDHQWKRKLGSNGSLTIWSCVNCPRERRQNHYKVA